jgi:hypothetical protein
METTIKAIFIDAKNKEVKQITLPNEETLKSVYPMIGDNCSLVEGVTYVNNFDLLLGDEDAYYHGYNFGFVLEGYGYIHGNAVILGSDNEGENADVDQYLFSQMRDKIHFVEEKVSEYMIKKVQSSPFTFSAWDI